MLKLEDLLRGLKCERPVILSLSMQTKILSMTIALKELY